MRKIEWGLLNLTNTFGFLFLFSKMQGKKKFKTFLGSRGHKSQVTHINIEGKVKFKLEGSENKFFPHLSSRTP